MWQPSDIWKAYTGHFDDLESAREQWSRETLEFLNSAAQAVSDSAWAQKVGLEIEQIEVKAWFQRRNLDYVRYSRPFYLDSPYKFQMRIGVGAIPGSKNCVFYTHFDCKLKNGGMLRKKEDNAVRQFAKRRNVALDPERPASVYFVSMDAMGKGCQLKEAVSAAKDTIEGMKGLKKLLMATRKG